MVEAKDEKGFVDERYVIFKEVELKVNRNNPELVDKVIFHKEGGDITWKPKIPKQTYEGPYKVSKFIQLEKGCMPKKIDEIAMACSESGQCKVKVQYNYWVTEKDGEEVTYRYILSEKTLDKWEIIKEEIKEEKVAP